jgi:hypothetical protein
MTGEFKEPKPTSPVQPVSLSLADEDRQGREKE